MQPNDEAGKSEEVHRTTNEIANSDDMSWLKFCLCAIPLMLASYLFDLKYQPNTGGQPMEVVLFYAGKGFGYLLFPAIVVLSIQFIKKRKGNELKSPKLKILLSGAFLMGFVFFMTALRHSK